MMAYVSPDGNCERRLFLCLAAVVVMHSKQLLFNRYCYCSLSMRCLLVGLVYSLARVDLSIQSGAAFGASN